MLKSDLSSNLDKVQRIANASKLRRMLYHPYRYIKAIAFRKLIYVRTHKETQAICNTFFGTDINILLPSSTDIYLTGGKSHDSEIKLARFLINHLKESNTFIDVGAHYGYFSLLAAKLVTSSGKVYAFEAAPKTFYVLSKNAKSISNLTAFNMAVSDTEEELKFFEFPNLYAEYNTLDVTQFENEKWFKTHQPTEVTVPSIILDDFLTTEKINFQYIKIDVEGAELKVINGLTKYLSSYSPTIIMEYLSERRGNAAHVQAENKLKKLGYHSHVINSEGFPEKVPSVNDYISSSNLESDNIVFIK